MNTTTKTRRRFDMESLIALVLRTGVTSSFVLILVGIVLTFLRHPELEEASGSAVSSWLTVGHLTSFPDLLKELAGLRGRAWTTLGLGLLILTPTVRVGVSILGFLRQSDRRFVAITLVVFTALLVSLFLGNATS